MCIGIQVFVSEKYDIVKVCIIFIVCSFCDQFLLQFLRRLLFLSIDDILGDEAVVSGDPLPHSYILNFLFSSAPSEMRSPHLVIKYQH